MANNYHSVDHLFRNLDETEKREIIRIAGIPDDRPGILRDRGGSGDEINAWMSRNRTRLVPALLRTVNLTNDEVSRLVGDGDLTPGETTTLTAQRISFSFLATPANEPGEAAKPIGAPLTDVAAAAALLSELFVVLGGANYPFGVDFVPPPVNVERGSVEITVGGSAFASGLGLIVACSAGLIAAPIIAPVAGGILATVGAVELALGWRKQILEMGKLKAETEKTRVETEAAAYQLAMTRRRDAETVRESEARRFAYSALVPRSVVQREAQRYGFNEAYANHLLNRTLPTYYAARRYCDKLAVQEVRGNQ